MLPNAPLRRITTWLSVLGYALVAAGLPLPFGVAPVVATAPVVAKRLAGKDPSRPFPCMDKPCGCDSADRCFTNCCCHAPDEILAWARARRIEAGVLASLEQRSARARSAPSGQQSSAEAAPCCQQEASSARRTEDCGGVRTPACIGEATGPSRDTTADGQAPSRPDREKPRKRQVTLRAVLACGGFAAEWLAAGMAVAPPIVQPTHGLVPVDRCPLADVSGAGGRAAPEPPPPRVA